MIDIKIWERVRWHIDAWMEIGAWLLASLISAGLVWLIYWINTP